MENQRKEGVNTLQCPPKGGVPLIKICKVDMIFKMLIFPKNNKTKYIRETNIYKNWPCSYVEYEKSDGYVLLFKN